MKLVFVNRAYAGAVEATDEDKLYGSVAAPQIVDALKEIGLEVDRHSVHLPEPIRQLGVYNVSSLVS